MKKEDLIRWAEENGWSISSFGHLHKGEYRLKIQARSVRLEMSYRSEVDRKKKYLRVSSAYFSELSISEEGKLIGLKK